MANTKTARRRYASTCIYSTDGYSEDIRKSQPSPADLQETYDMFEDFDIPIPELPYFATYYQLERWRKTYILNYLNNLNKRLTLTQISKSLTSI